MVGGVAKGFSSRSESSWYACSSSSAWASRAYPEAAGRDGFEGAIEETVVDESGGAALKSTSLYMCDMASASIRLRKTGM